MRRTELHGACQTASHWFFCHGSLDSLCVLQPPPLLPVKSRLRRTATFTGRESCKCGGTLSRLASLVRVVSGPLAFNLSHPVTQSYSVKVLGSSDPLMRRLSCTTSHTSLLVSCWNGVSTHNARARVLHLLAFFSCVSRALPYSRPFFFFSSGVRRSEWLSASRGVPVSSAGLHP